jgi:uncharacterized membrane protein YeaQ/YmgE (transglycosylase-associated protein family)
MMMCVTGFAISLHPKCALLNLLALFRKNYKSGFTNFFRVLGMGYKNILNELLVRYERAYSHRNDKDTDKKDTGNVVDNQGIEDIVEKYAFTLDPEDRTSNHMVQYYEFLQEMRSLVTERYLPVVKRWGHMLSGSLCGFISGAFVGESVLSNTQLGMFCGVIAGTAGAVVISYSHSHFSYRLEARSVVADYERALKRADLLALREEEHKDELLLDSAIAMQSGDRKLKRAVRKELEEYFSQKLHAQLPPKKEE